MDPDDQRRPLSAAKAVMFLGVTAAGIGLALWLVSCGGASCIPPPWARPQPARNGAASPRPVAVGNCTAAEVSLIGAFNTCVGWDASFASNCAPDALSLVQRMRNGDSQFVLYVEVDGGYHGPGAYPLGAWPHPTLGARDGAAKVAVREVRTGALWRSIGGSLVVDRSGRAVNVDAALAFAGAPSSPATRGLKADGPWRC